MARKRGVDYIPGRDDDFFNFQTKLVNMVVANKVAWGIPDGAVNPLVARRAEYEPLYAKSQEKKDRTSGDVDRHRQSRQLYEKEIRTFVNSYIRYNPAVPRDKKVEMSLTIPDTEPTPRPQITTIPIVGLRSMGGGDIEVRCREEHDQTRPSMHPAADAIECGYVLAAVGQKPPDDPESMARTQTSKKARFLIHCGDKQAGQRFYGFFRWANQTNSQNSGPWSPAQTVVIA